MLPLGASIARPTPASSERVADILRGKTAKVSNLIRGRATDRYITTMEMPIVNSGGTQYVLSQWVYSKHFARVFPQSGVPTEWLFGIFDRDGRTIVRSMGPEQFEGKLPKEDLLRAIVRGESGYMNFLMPVASFTAKYRWRKSL